MTECYLSFGLLFVFFLLFHFFYWLPELLLQSYFTLCTGRNDSTIQVVLNNSFLRRSFKVLFLTLVTYSLIFRSVYAPDCFHHSSHHSNQIIQIPKITVWVSIPKELLYEDFAYRYANYTRTGL